MAFWDDRRLGSYFSEDFRMEVHLNRQQEWNSAYQGELQTTLCLALNWCVPMQGSRTNVIFSRHLSRWWVPYSGGASGNHVACGIISCFATRVWRTYSAPYQLWMLARRIHVYLWRVSLSSQWKVRVFFFFYYFWALTCPISQLTLPRPMNAAMIYSCSFSLCSVP